MNLFAFTWLYIVAALLSGVWSAKQPKDFSGTRAAEAAPRGWYLLLLLTVALGVYLRFGGITFGLPYHFHPDEIPKAQVIARMQATGSFNPHYFLHPTLLLYLALGINKVLHLFWTQQSYYETAFLAGRIVSATAGSLSIYLLYIIGRELLGVVPGVMTAALFALFPLQVTVSRYMKEDALLTFFILLTLAAVLKARRTHRKTFSVLAGLCAGLAFGTKYTGVLTACMLFLLPREDIVAALATMCVGFCIATPYSLFDPKEFFGGLLFEKNHALRGHTESISAWSQWWLYHWIRSIVPGVTLLPAVVFIVGGGIALTRRTFAGLVIFASFLLFYLPAEWVPSKPAPQAERYIAVCLPFIALGISYALWNIRTIVKPFLMAGIFFAAIGFSAFRSLQLFEALSPDTREVATEWVKANIPHGSAVVMDFEPYALDLPKGDFTIVNDPFLPVGQYVDIGKLQELHAQYIVLSSLSYDRFFTQPNQSAVERVKYRTLFSRLPLVAEFSNPVGRYGFHNPIIRIYHIE